MHIVDPELLATLMVQVGYKPGLQPSEEMLRLATAIVEHCAEVAASCQPVLGKDFTPGAQIRAEWGLD